MIQLSEHFTLAEMTRSYTAIKQGINNEPNERQIARLTALCQDLLEPIRAHVGGPIHVSSGYRSPDLCEAIGSSRRSRHTLGQAADIKIGEFMEDIEKQSHALVKLAGFMAGPDCPFRYDGMVVEAPNTTFVQWLHVSWDDVARPGSQQKRTSIYLGGGNYQELVGTDADKAEAIHDGFPT